MIRSLLDLTLEPSSAAARLEIGDAGRDVAPGNYFRWKNLIGRLLATILLIPGLPIICGLVILVRLTSRGPGIFRQQRVGRNGRIFVMYKIRTMVDRAERNTGPVWASQDDPRSTPVGLFLRRYHLDEFPQLFNVLKGDMTLIGPRPERPEIVPVLAERVPGYLNRLAVPAGVTGLAQINLPPDEDLESVKRKLQLDLLYIKTANPFMDIRILCYHVLRLFAIPCETAYSVLGLRRRVTSHSKGPAIDALNADRPAARQNGSHKGSSAGNGKNGAEASVTAVNKADAAHATNENLQRPR